MRRTSYKLGARRGQIYYLSNSRWHKLSPRAVRRFEGWCRAQGGDLFSPGRGLSVRLVRPAFGRKAGQTLPRWLGEVLKHSPVDTDWIRAWHVHVRATVKRLHDQLQRRGKRALKRGKGTRLLALCSQVGQLMPPPYRAREWRDSGLATFRPALAINVTRNTVTGEIYPTVKLVPTNEILMRWIANDPEVVWRYTRNVTYIRIEPDRDVYRVRAEWIKVLGEDRGRAILRLARTLGVSPP